MLLVRRTPHPTRTNAGSTIRSSVWSSQVARATKALEHIVANAPVKIRTLRTDAVERALRWERRDNACKYRANSSLPLPLHSNIPSYQSTLFSASSALDTTKSSGKVFPHFGCTLAAFLTNTSNTLFSARTYSSSKDPLASLDVSKGIGKTEKKYLIILLLLAALMELLAGTHNDSINAVMPAIAIHHNPPHSHPHSQHCYYALRPTAATLTLPQITDTTAHRHSTLPHAHPRIHLFLQRSLCPVPIGAGRAEQQ